jgi:hypothetical protein
MYVNDPGRSVHVVKAEDVEQPAQADAALTSIAAHGMLNSLGVAKATISTIRLHWKRLDEETCLRLLLRAEAQLTFLGDTLGDLVRGIPADARDLLDDLDRPTIIDDFPQDEAPDADS